MISSAQRVKQAQRKGKSAKRRLRFPPKDPVQAAQAAGLRYVQDDRPGIRRVRAGRGFRYFRPDGTAVRDPEELGRIRSLAIPPAWTDVWICPSPNGHLQATGRDARGRKQHRYHPRWREVRDEAKYGRLMAFGRALPKIRARVQRELAQSVPDLPPEEAAVLALLQQRLQEQAGSSAGFGGVCRLDRSPKRQRGGTALPRWRFGLRSPGPSRRRTH